MSRPFALLAIVLLVISAACGSGGGGPDASVGPSGSLPTSSLAPAPDAVSSVDPEGELCLRVTDVEQRLASLRAVELRLPNRVALAIELDKLQAAFIELENADFGMSEERLAGSLKRLGYRLGELELAVEDFRTNPRIRRAIPNVEGDAQKVADELAAFVILSRC